MSVTIKSCTLYWAFRDGNVSLSTKLLADFPKYDVEPKLESTAGLYNDTLLHLACRHGWLDIVKCLIEEYGFAPNISDNGNQTPLHYACRYGHLNIVRYLTSHQHCDVTATSTSSDHWTPLHYACRYGYMNIVEYLASLPSVIQNVDQSSVLHLTCEYGQSNILIYLMDKKGFSPGCNCRNENFSGLLLTACLHEHAHLLKDINSYQHLELEMCKILFMFCCKNGLLDILKRLTLEVSEVSYTIDEFGKTGIHYASQNGHTAIVKHLIEECGSSINTLESREDWNPCSVCDLNGDTALHLSARYHRYEVAHYLITVAKCDPNIKNKYGETLIQLLFSIRSWTDSECIKLLVVLTSTGLWYPNLKCNLQGDTALHLSARYHRYKVAHYLLSEVKCYPNIRNFNGETQVQLLLSLMIPHSHVKDSQCKDMIKALTSNKQWDPNSSGNSSGDTALHLSIMHYRYEVAHYLITETQCNPNIKNKSGDTPIQLLMSVKFWSDSECINTIKVLISTRLWDPNSSCSSNGDTVLHLSCSYHRYEVTHYLLTEVKCNPNITNLNGKTQVQLLLPLIISTQSDSECKRLIKALMSTKQWDPNCCCNSSGDTALHLSARYHRYKVSHFLLTETSCDPNIKKRSGEKPIHLLLSAISCSGSDLECLNAVKVLASITLWDPNSSCNFNRDTALHLSVRHHRDEVAHYLLTETKCDPNIRNFNGETPIHLLMSVKSWSDSECINTIKVLTSTWQWDPNLYCNSNRDTVLHLSCSYHRYEVTHYLLSEVKCNPNITNLNGKTQVQLLLPSIISIRSDSECKRLIKALMSTKQWDPNSCCNPANGDTALHHSVKQHRCEVADYLLTEAKCDPSVKNKLDETPIQLLMSERSWSDLECLNTIKVLTSTQRWNPNSSCSFRGDTALHLSAKCHRYEVAHFLLTEAKCAPNIKNQSGDTPIQPLMSAQSWSDFECLNIVKVLTSTRLWDPNSSCNSNGDTTLHLSARHHRYEVAYYLLSEVKCDPNVRNINGETQIQLLLPSIIPTWSDSECKKMIKALMLTEKWDYNSSCNSSGDTALHLSAKYHRYEVTHLLIAASKRDTNVKNQSGDTPIQLLMSAKSWSDLECLNIIKVLTSTRLWDPNSSCNSNGDTTLHLSARHHRYEVAYYLLSEVKCDPNVRNINGETQIQLLLPSIIPTWSDSECKKMIKALMLTEKWDYNSSCNSSGDTALHLSAKYHRYEVTHLLIAASKRDTNVKNQSGDTPIQLLMSAKSWSDLECLNIIKVLTSTRLWDPNSSCNSNGDTTLHLSARHHRYEVAYYLLSEVKCDPNVRNINGETQIQLLLPSIIPTWSDSECKKMIKALMSTEKWDYNSSCNSSGDTALHLSAKYHRYEVTHLLIAASKRDTNVKNQSGDTPIQLLMSAKSWSDLECLNIIKVLTSTRLWDPNSSCNSNGDTTLHLSARHHRYEVAYYLLSEVKCDPYVRNINGETQVQLLLQSIIPTWSQWSDSGCKKMIKALMSTEKWDPNSSCNPNGDTALHLSARHNKYAIVHLLLSEAKCDPNITNIYDKTPLQLANHSSIINDLISYGASPENVYKSSLGRSVGLKKTLTPPVKVFIIGNSGVGKSTLTEALKIETSFLVKAFTKRKRVSSVDEKTAGIVPHEFESKLYGQVIFYDFAGQREFYNSHIAILQNVIQSSSPIFLIVVNLSNSEEEIQQNIHYWLFFLENNCNTAHSKPHIIIIGSHADIAVEIEDPQRTASKISIYIQEVSQNLELEFVGMYPIDCRFPESPNMTELRSCLKDTCRILRIPNTISFNAHCFYVFLLDKFSMSVAVTVDDVRNEIEKQIDLTQTGVVNYLPDSISALNLVCDELNDRGHILFLKNHDNIEKSWVIIDKTSLLSKVTGTIFAPNDFKEHCQIAESTGVVPLSRLITNFPDYKSEVLIGFLTHLEYCHEIDDREVHELIIQHQESSKSTTIESENEHYFLFPGLITLNAPRGIWKQNHKFKHHCFWIIKCTRQDQFFSSRFTQVLLLRLAFSFALIKKEVNPAIPALQRECSIWKNGIFWGEMFGMEIIVEIYSSKVMFLMRYQEENILHCIAKRSSIIQKISQCAHDLCSNIEIVESFIDPSEATEFPLKSPVSSETPQFSLQKIAETIVKSTEYRTQSVVSSTGTISLDYLLTFEPYAELGMAALKKLCTSESVFEKKISDSFLKHLSRKFSKKAKLFIELFSSAPSHLSSTTSEDLFTKLQTWRDECNGTYKCLKEKLDQFSVFAGRNVLVSYLLHMHFKIPFVYCVSLTWCFHFFYRSCLLLNCLKMTQK